MAEITQVLGFEAASAIATLNSLNGAIRQVNTSIRAMNKATAGATGLTNLSTNLNKVNTSAKTATTGMQKFGKNATRATKQANTAVNSLTVSWGTMARIVGTQLVVRGIAALQQALGDAATRTKEFETATLRAALVSEEGVEGVDNLREAFERLTIATGRSIEEISEAGTEALQKDLGDTKETMDLLSGAADDLARITGTSLTSAVNSISSVMKAFNLDLSQADSIADTFFVTIDKGDIKLGEVESRLGTVNPLISTLGGNFEDAAGAAAALTLSGLNTQTAMTQLRNVAIKLIKPTDAMKEVFKELGVTTSTELIPKFGSLESVLKALSGEVGKDRQQFGELFNTIRGLLGVLNLTGNEGQILAGVMEAMGDKAGKAKEGADALKQTLSFLNDTSLQTLLREIDTFGPALNETRLGATILATNFIGVMKDMADATAAFKDAAVANFNDVVAAIDNFSKSGTAKIQEVRLDSLNEQVENAKRNFQDAAQSIRDAATQERLDSGLTGEAKAEFDALSQAAEASAVAQAKLNEQVAQMKSLIDTNTQAQQGFADQARNAANAGLLDGERTKQQKQEALEISQRILELDKQAQTAQGAALTQIKQEADLERRKLETKAQEGTIDAKQLDAIRGQIVVLEQNIKARERLKLLEADSASQVQVQEAIKREQLALTRAELLKIPEAADQGTTAINNIPDPQVNASAAIAQMRALEQAALAAARAVAAANSGGGGGNSYHGGTPVYRAAGGPSRGQDNQATMLSKGEFVTNARSTAKFFPQLSAMNNGQSPAFREQGGSVTNVGDITVNVTGGSGSESPDVAGRAIANSLRREIRRKTSAL